MDKYYVYKHTFSNGTVYFGKGSNDRISSNKRNRYWKSLYKKYGEPTREYLNTGLSEDLAFIIEAAYIDCHKQLGVSLCNISTGGEASASGYRHTEEAKKRISEGVSKYWGKKLGADRLKTKKKVKVAKKKVVDGQKAKHCNRKKVQQYTLEGLLVAEYTSIRAATAVTGVNGGNISSVCYNKLKSAGGFHWRFK